MEGHAVGGRMLRGAPEVADLHIAVGSAQGKGQPMALFKAIKSSGEAGEASPSQLVRLVGSLHQSRGCQVLQNRQAPQWHHSKTNNLMKKYVFMF
jgi:hypothetical protein